MDYLRIEIQPEAYPGAGSGNHLVLNVRTKYQGQEYGAMIPLKPDFMESDFDSYMDASLAYLKEILRRALKGETIG